MWLVSSICVNMLGRPILVDVGLDCCDVMALSGVMIVMSTARDR